MSDSVAAPPAKKVQRRPRAWWQWLVGVVLLTIAVGSIGIRWVKTTMPVWYLRLMVEKPIPLKIPAGLREANALPLTPGTLLRNNLLLITLDTTRADRIGCYGNDGIETPHLDRLATEGALFSRAYAPGSTTLPSHCTVLTGLYPYHHEARANAFTRLPDDKVTLADVLSEQGYSTGGFVSAFVLNSRFGIAQGFSKYDDEVTEKLDPDFVMRDAERRAAHTTDRAIEWVRKTDGKPFFAWVHYFDPHQPYTPPSEFAQKYRKSPYDGEIASVDVQIGRLMDLLNEMKVAEKTLVVVIGDHGQGFLQHLELTHGLFLYDSTVRVPFIMWCEKRLGGVHIPRDVSSVDVMPTVLSLLGIPCPGPVDGEDLTQPPRDLKRAIFSETLEGLDQSAVAPLMCVREGSMKYIYGPEPELYDLSADPDEEVNIIEQYPEAAAALKERLTTFYKGDLASAAHIANAEQLTAEELARLRALGYAGGDGTALVPGAASFPDPKSVIVQIYQCERAWQIREQEGIEAAIEHLDKQIDDAPEYYVVHRLKAFFLLDAKRYEEALEELHRCLELHPDIPFPLVHIARAHLHSGRIEKAIEFYKKAIKANPDLVVAHMDLGRILLSRNQPAVAVDYLLKAFMLSPTDQTCVEAMTMAMAQTGREDEAISLLRFRLSKNPHHQFVRNSLCALLMDQNRCEEVLPLMREGVRQDPENPALINNLAYAITKCKRPEATMIEAAVMMERVCHASNYEVPEYLRTLALIYAELSRYDEAIGVSEKALALAEKKNRSLARDLTKLIAFCRNAKATGNSQMSFPTVPASIATSQPAKGTP